MPRGKESTKKAKDKRQAAREAARKAENEKRYAPKKTGGK